MAISVKTNNLTGPASTGNSSSTDPGFQPKGLLIWNGVQTATGASSDAQFSIGVASSTTTENSGGYNSNDASASSDVVRIFSTTDVIRNTTAGATTLNLVATLTSFDATGFTLNWGTLATTSPLYNYLALGGADITNVNTGNFAANTSTGNQSVTGVGFQPNVIILFANLNTTSTQTNNNSCFGIGVATSSTERWAIAVGMQNGQATMNNRRAFYDNVCFMHPAAGSNNVEATADFVSMDTDGFTINWTDAPGQADLIGYMAIRGGQWKAGVDTQKTSTGTKATTGIGFTPSGVLFGSVCDTNNNTIVDNARFMVGCTDGTRNTTVWTGDSDNVPDSIANTITSSTKCLVMATEAVSASPTTQAEANISTLDSDGFTLDWTTADATARDFGYLAFGSNAKTETLIDAFDQVTLNTSKWLQFTGGSATFTYDATGAQVNFPASSTSSTDGDISSTKVFDLTASYAQMHVITVPSAATSADAELRLKLDGTSWLRWVYEGGTLFAQYRAGGGITTVSSVAYNSSTHAYWRIREASGTVYWDTSTDGASWSNFTSVATPIGITALTTLIAGTCFQNETSPGAFKWNNYNVVQSASTVKTLAALGVG